MVREKVQNDLQNITQTTKDRATRTPLNTEDEYQSDNQTQYIEDGHSIQWSKKKDKQQYTKHYTENKRSSNTTPLLKTVDEHNI